MAKVAIVMGSDSDMPIMKKAAEFLDQMGIDFEMTIISAHREPDIFFEWAKGAKDRGVKVIIAGAGKAAHLPGMCAALFPMPVIGIPMKTSDLGGVDSLYSIVQMPSGIPVATVAINGGLNAGILAAKILATSDEKLLEKLEAYSEEMKQSVVEKAEKLDKVGYKIMNKKILAAFLCVCMVVVTGSFPVSAAKTKKTYKIAIDAGHQGKGNSKTEPIGPGAKMRKPKVAYGTQGVKTKVPESKLTLQIALKLEKELKKRGYDVYMIRRKQNVNISNKQRAIRVNKSGADICIRLHADAASANVGGVSVLYPSRQNPYVAKLSKKSKKLSKNILDSYCKSTKFKKRGLSKRDDLTGTNWSKIPVALIEMGFMTNKTEDKQMQKKQTQKKMVDGIANGIDQYFK